MIVVPQILPGAVGGRQLQGIPVRVQESPVLCHSSSGPQNQLHLPSQKGLGVVVVVVVVKTQFVSASSQMCVGAAPGFGHGHEVAHRLSIRTQLTPSAENQIQPSGGQLAGVVEVVDVHSQVVVVEEVVVEQTTGGSCSRLPSTQFVQVQSSSVIPQN